MTTTAIAAPASPDPRRNPAMPTFKTIEDYEQFLVPAEAELPPAPEPPPPDWSHEELEAWLADYQFLLGVTPRFEGTPEPVFFSPSTIVVGSSVRYMGEPAQVLAIGDDHRLDLAYRVDGAFTTASDVPYGFEAGYWLSEEEWQAGLPLSPRQQADLAIRLDHPAAPTPGKWVVYGEDRSEALKRERDPNAITPLHFLIVPTRARIVDYTDLETVTLDIYLPEPPEEEGAEDLPIRREYNVQRATVASQSVERFVKRGLGGFFDFDLAPLIRPFGPIAKTTVWAPARCERCGRGCRSTTPIGWIEMGFGATDTGLIRDLRRGFRVAKASGPEQYQASLSICPECEAQARRFFSGVDLPPEPGSSRPIAPWSKRSAT